MENQSQVLEKVNSTCQDEIELSKDEIAQLLNIDNPHEFTYQALIDRLCQKRDYPIRFKWTSNKSSYCQNDQDPISLDEFKENDEVVRLKSGNCYEPDSLIEWGKDPLTREEFSDWERSLLDIEREEENLTEEAESEESETEDIREVLEQNVYGANYRGVLNILRDGQIPPETIRRLSAVAYMAGDYEIYDLLRMNHGTPNLELTPEDQQWLTDQTYYFSNLLREHVRNELHFNVESLLRSNVPIYNETIRNEYDMTQDEVMRTILADYCPF